MSTHHAIVWLDRSEAHIIQFDRAHVESQVIKTRKTFKKAKGGHAGDHLNKHGRESEIRGNHTPDGGHAQGDEDFYHDVALALTGVTEILVTGPAQAKDEFRAHCKRHDKAIEQAIVDVIASDHPSDGQLLAMAKKYFLGHDRMHGGPGR